MTSIARGAVASGLIVVLATGIMASSFAAESPPAAFNNHCRTCHSVKEGDNRLGPSLHGVYGAKAGSSSGYGNYSQGLKSSDIVWNETTLDKFIENPDQVIPNNNMEPFKGVSDPALRKQIVDFLKSQRSPPDSNDGAEPA